MAVADDNLGSMLGSLEATFDARLARAEDEAASDLAFSLLQDLSLTEALERAGPLQVLRAGHPPIPVTEIGADYLGCAPATFIPLGRAIARPIAGPTPVRTDQPLVALLRRHARRGTCARVTARGAVHTGVLARACRDHVVIARRRRGLDALEPASAETFIPLDLIDEIRLEDGEA